MITADALLKDPNDLINEQEQVGKLNWIVDQKNHPATEALMTHLLLRYLELNPNKTNCKKLLRIPRGIDCFHPNTGNLSGKTTFWKEFFARTKFLIEFTTESHHVINKDLLKLFAKHSDRIIVNMRCRTASKADEASYYKTHSSPEKRRKAIKSLLKCNIVVNGLFGPLLYFNQTKYRLAELFDLYYADELNSVTVESETQAETYCYMKSLDSLKDLEHRGLNSYVEDLNEWATKTLTLFKVSQEIGKEKGFCVIPLAEQADRCINIVARGSLSQFFSRTIH